MAERGTVLVDMDGVLFDWQEGVDRIGNELARERGIDWPCPPPAVTHRFRLESYAMTPDELRLVHDARSHPELFGSLQPLPGAITALNEIAEDYDTFIVSTPDESNPTCASAKYQSMAEHFGSQWSKRTILSHDKTLVAGHVLIDDKPDITGLLQDRQTWIQVVFDQPQNRAFLGPRLHRWADWRSVIEPLLGV